MKEAVRVSDKKIMYKLLSTGHFGNTVPMWFDVSSWQADPVHRQYPLWGLRSMLAMDKRMYLDVPTADVVGKVNVDFKLGVNISPMVDPWLIFRAEVWDSPSGLYVHGTWDRELKWREAMATTRREYTGTLARNVLRSVMNDNSYDDLGLLLDTYPEHVIEFTALDRCRGLVPGRNTIIWEVRDY